MPSTLPVTSAPGTPQQNHSSPSNGSGGITNYAIPGTSFNTSGTKPNIISSHAVPNGSVPVISHSAGSVTTIPTGHGALSNHTLPNGVPRPVISSVSPQNPPPSPGNNLPGTVVKNVRTGVTALNNVFTTGGLTPGIKQATLISGVGVSVPGGGPVSSSGMTVSSGGAATTTPGQAGQSQTIVLSKGAGVTMASPGALGISQNPPPGSVVTSNQVPQSIAIGTGSGLQLVNMNSINTVRTASVNVGAVNIAGGNASIASAGPAVSKTIAPRMILSPQVLANARPGQPVQEIVLKDCSPKPVCKGDDLQEVAVKDRKDHMQGMDISEGVCEESVPFKLPYESSPMSPKATSTLDTSSSVAPISICNVANPSESSISTSCDSTLAKDIRSCTNESSDNTGTLNQPCELTEVAASSETLGKSSQKDTTSDIVSRLELGEKQDSENILKLCAPEGEKRDNWKESETLRAEEECIVSVNAKQSDVLEALSDPTTDNFSDLISTSPSEQTNGFGNSNTVVTFASESRSKNVHIDKVSSNEPAFEGSTISMNAGIPKSLSPRIQHVQALQHSRSPVSVRVPPMPTSNSNPEAASLDPSLSNREKLVDSSKTPPAFTTDANLYSQFLQFNRIHPMDAQNNQSVTSNPNGNFRGFNIDVLPEAQDVAPFTSTRQLDMPTSSSPYNVAPISDFPYNNNSRPASVEDPDSVYHSTSIRSQPPPMISTNQVAHMNPPLRPVQPSCQSLQPPNTWMSISTTHDNTYHPNFPTGCSPSPNMYPRYARPPFIENRNVRPLNQSQPTNVFDHSPSKVPPNSASMRANFQPTPNNYSQYSHYQHLSVNSNSQMLVPSSSPTTVPVSLASCQYEKKSYKSCSLESSENLYRQQSYNQKSYNFSPQGMQSTGYSNQFNKPSGVNYNSSSSGLPVICRVSPIRTRYENPGSFGATQYSNVGFDPGSSNYNRVDIGSSNDNRFRPSMSSPSLGPRPGISFPNQLPYSYSYSPSRPFRPRSYSAETHSGYSFSGCQDFDDMRRLRTQITLQALPGLQPGAQGHHLLVKTENGQYQLLRVGNVGMPAPAAAPTAVTGTPGVPSTVATTSSLSIAQQLPNNNAPSSSTSSLSVSNSNHVSTSVVNTLVSSASSAPSSVVVPPSNSSSPLVGTVLSSTGSSSTNATLLTQQSNQQIVTGTTTVVVPTAATAPSTLGTTKSGVGSANSSTSSSTSSPIPNNPSSPATTNRLPSIPPNAANNPASGVGMASMSMQQQQQMYPPPQVHVPNSVSMNASNTANTVSQMSSETAKIKCKNFLSFLLELSAKQNQQVARNVKALIQGLVDGKVNEETFSDRLQKEVNSQPQPCLVGFLKKSLPHLRHSLATNELKIEGIKPPAVTAAPVTALIPQNQQQVRPSQVGLPPSTPVRIITPIIPNSGTPPYAAPVTSMGTSTSGNSGVPRGPSPGTKSTVKAKSSSAAPGSTVSPSSSSPTAPKGPLSKPSAKDKEKKSFASGYSGDDDINDVAAMGGVNLAEESQKILGSTEFVGTQIRSVRDETFLHVIPLQSKLKAIAAKYGFEEPPLEVASLISHATEERLKTLIEKLAVIAEHRLDVIKMDERYSVTQDVKGQLRFLDELEKLEKKRHDEQEREMLIRAAKSRSKSEDPEQAKLKAKAKEMQRVAMEEMRQREANLTALQAIGPRKKPKLDTQSGSQSTISQSPLGGIGASSSGRPQMAMRPRLKRVNVRDLLFLLEQEKDTTRSQFLYKHLLMK